MALKPERLPFSEQIDFFRQKADLPTRAWTDIYLQEHDRAFVVAGAMKEALVKDLREAVRAAIEDGRDLAWFRKEFDAIVERHGWRYNGGRGWRTRVIYETNLYTSYAAGRLAQMEALRDVRPYWIYRHSDWVRYPRPEHVRWDGLTLRADDAWWRTHYPPNGWGCKCYVETASEDGLRRLGKRGPDQAPPIEWETKPIGVRGPSPRTVRVPKGIDPGFEYQPGRTWLDGQVPPPRTTPPPKPTLLPPDTAPPDAGPAAPPPPDTASPDASPTAPPDAAPPRTPEPLPPEPPLRPAPDGLPATVDEALDRLSAKDQARVIPLPGIGPLVAGPGMARGPASGGAAPAALYVAVSEPMQTAYYIEWPAGVDAPEVRHRVGAHVMLDGEPAWAVLDFGPSGWWADWLPGGAWLALGAIAWTAEQ